MSNGHANSSTGAAKPLTRDVLTGQDNTLHTVPFAVLGVTAGDEDGKWDPSQGPLRVEYGISDRNGLAKSGRILYFTKPHRSGGAVSDSADGEMILYRQSLNSDEIKPGTHVTSKWDGNISEGMQDRIGKRVTADLSPVFARVELWNQPTPSPGKPDGSGQTDVPDQYLSSKEARTVIDVIVKAEWDNYRCIPFVVDPRDKAEAKKYKRLEPELGVTKMKIRVNLAEGTDVRIMVCRIVDIQDPSKDELYACTPTDKELEEGGDDEMQKGLYWLTVDKKGRVTLAGVGRGDPYVEWKNYGEHWKHEGENNFYCFKLGFGKDGRYMVASERDYGEGETDLRVRRKKERRCLHMRFTVHIHCPAPDLPRSRKEAKRLHAFFRKKTEYYRSYLTTSASTLDEFHMAFRHRYVFVFTGHAACSCLDASHPRTSEEVKVGKRTLKKGALKDVPREDFAPDQNRCPTDVSTDVYGGCGNKPEVRHHLVLGKIGGRRLYLAVLSKSEGNASVLLGIEKGKPTDPKIRRTLDLSSECPRLMMYTATCRSILTTNLGELFTRAGTKYFVGYTYTSDDDDNLCERFFNRWIKGTKKQKARSEFDTLWLVTTFISCAASHKNSRTRHPRIITQLSNALSPEGPLAG
jgi:hypothetical protein